jgi:hypothetical protein
MKATQILYLILIVGVIFWIVSSTQILNFAKEGFQEEASLNSEPTIPRVLVPTSINIEAMPNPTTLDTIPFGPYAQMASTGSYQYKDPATLPAELSQMKKLNEDIRSFLAFEGVSISDTSDPSVQLPLTQLRSDSQKLQSEISVLTKNPGIDSQITQQELADIEGSLSFLQRKIRLFETSGVISDKIEGFTSSSDSSGNTVKTKATKAELSAFLKRIYAAILTLSASGSKDAVVQARIQRLENMYTAINDLVIKLNNGDIKNSDIPIYKEDINEILPKLADTASKIKNVFEQSSGKKFNLIEKQLSKLVGEDNAQSVFNNLKDTGMFRVNIELGYNGAKKSANKPTFTQPLSLQEDGTLGIGDGILGQGDTSSSTDSGQPMSVNSAYDTTTQGMDDRSNSQSNTSMASRFDWKKRATSICEQVRLRGLDPEDFGCIAKDSLMSPAYSWRGHSKMICGRLAATVDPNLPIVCGCPPSNWKGWTLPL